MLKDTVLEVLQSIGIYADINDMNVPLNTLIPESITFVSFIVELEKVIGIEIPDEFLIVSSFNNLEEFVNAVALLVPKV